MNRNFDDWFVKPGEEEYKSKKPFEESVRQDNAYDLTSQLNRWKKGYFSSATNRSYKRQHILDTIKALANLYPEEDKKFEHLYMLKVFLVEELDKANFINNYEREGILNQISEIEHKMALYPNKKHHKLTSGDGCFNVVITMIVLSIIGLIAYFCWPLICVIWEIICLPYNVFLNPNQWGGYHSATFMDFIGFIVCMILLPGFVIGLFKR